MIVGGGFGGLEAAKALGRTDVRVTVVDRKNHHCFQPLLYQVATAALSPADVAWPIRGILSRQQNVQVIMAEVTGIDVHNRYVYAVAADQRLRGEQIVIEYDFVVLATGAAYSYFGHEAWIAVAPGLKSIEDATEIRRRILLAFEDAEIAPEPQRAAAGVVASQAANWIGADHDARTDLCVIRLLRAEIESSHGAPELDIGAAEVRSQCLRAP